MGNFSSLMLEASGASNVVNYILIGVVVLMLIALPIMMNARNKRETQKIQEQTNSLKVGDKILTTSGVYGTIVELKFDDTQKIIVIETGGKNKSYMAIDAYAVYTVFKNDVEVKAEEKAVEEKQEETANVEEIVEPKKTKRKSKKEDI